MTPPHIQIIIGSIREGRVGEPVARWFAERNRAWPPLPWYEGDDRFSGSGA
jgi:hypothetical protein